MSAVLFSQWKQDFYLTDVCGAHASAPQFTKGRAARLDWLTVLPPNHKCSGLNWFASAVAAVIAACKDTRQWPLTRSAYKHVRLRQSSAAV